MTSLRRAVRPSSHFPYSPLTDGEARKRSDAAAHILTLAVLFPEADAALQRRCLASWRQETADHLRGADVRCGFRRSPWDDDVA